ncbi:MAG: DEAD/DEAH box helicase, partial [Shimia sp.]
MPRPTSLYPLFSDLESLPGVGPKTAKSLSALRIEHPRDVLFHLPHTVIDRTPRPTLLGLDLPATATVEVIVGAHRAPSKRGAPYRVMVEDAQLAFSIVWFRPQIDFLRRTLPEGSRRLISGKVEWFDGQAQMVHPEHILPVEEAGDLPRFEPVYPLASGVTQKVLAKASSAALTRIPTVGEWIDGPLVQREGWPSFADALRSSHRPSSLDDTLTTAPHRVRLAYDEVFAHQLTLALARASQRSKPGRETRGDGSLARKVLDALPYAPTGAQTRAVGEITGDMASGRRMNRMLQGDVGSGKTLVAFLALLAAVEAGGQGVLMAPTEILARQHMEGLAPFAADAGVRIELL